MVRVDESVGTETKQFRDVFLSPLMISSLLWCGTFPEWLLGSVKSQWLTRWPPDFEKSSTSYLLLNKAMWSVLPWDCIIQTGVYVSSCLLSGLVMATRWLSGSAALPLCWSQSRISSSRRSQAASWRRSITTHCSISSRTRRERWPTFSASSLGISGGWPLRTTLCRRPPWIRWGPKYGRVKELWLFLSNLVNKSERCWWTKREI